MSSLPTNIDASSVHRLPGMAAIADVPAVADQDRLRSAFRARAEQFAQRKELGAKAAEQTALIVVRIGKERFALPLSHVVQVLPRVATTPVPGGADCLLGVANLRGQVRSVIDLRGLLNLDATDQQEGYVAVIRAGNAIVGLRVDGVDEVRQWDGGALDSADGSPPSLSGLVQAVTKDCIAVLDCDALIAQMRARMTTTRTTGGVS